MCKFCRHIDFRAAEVELRGAAKGCGTTVETYNVRYSRKWVESDFPFQTKIVTNDDHFLHSMYSGAKKQDVIRVHHCTSEGVSNPSAIGAVM